LIGVGNRFTKVGVARPVEAFVGVGPTGAGFENGVQVTVQQARPGYQRGDFLLLDHLPIDEFLDIRMV
jgi:hypothetical protein